MKSKNSATHEFVEQSATSESTNASSAHWFCWQNPFTSLYTHFNSGDYPQPKDTAILETLEEVMDVEATLSGDMDLGYIAHRIRMNDYSFVGSGLWLWQVRRYKSYLDTHDNFKDWCKDVVRKDYTTVLAMIKAALVWVQLVTMGFEILPTSIAQCVVMYKYIGDLDEFSKNWQYVIDNLEVHEFSKKNIKALLQGEIKKTNTTLTFPLKLFKNLERTALNCGISIIKLVEQMYEQIFTKVVRTQPEQMSRWYEDLALIVKEQDTKEAAETAQQANRVSPATS